MAPPTGVHRVAEQLILALDELLTAEPSLRARFEVELFAPRDLHHALALKTIAFRQGGLFTWIPWEQFDLPHHSRGAVIVSLCNLGPALAKNAVTMVHDAQVYISPGSYSKPFRLWYKFIQPLIGARHRRILTVSEFSRREIARFGVARLENISVIHNGVDHVLQTEADGEASSRFDLISRAYVLGLASTQAHKNVRVLLQAFKDPRLSHLKLVLFGGADRGELAQLAGGTLPDNVVLAGKVSDGELRALMDGALCLAFPSTTEGFGLPPLEAMTLGCPAICAPRGALPEVCGDAVLYAEPDVASEWVETILTLSGNPVRREELAKAGIVQARRFTWRDAALALVETLDDLAAAR
jgi:glycosyltransferase involved in cell wall biosynthesis